VTYCESEYQAAEGADAVVLVTEWGQFRGLNFDRLKRAMRAPVMIDLRNVYRAEDLLRHGFRYYRIGAPQFVPIIPFGATAWPGPAPHRPRVDGIKRGTNGSDRSKQRKPLPTSSEATSAR
jgi:hypothetical protein